MAESYQTEQETFWTGNFGDEYITRNSDPRGIANRTALFAKIITRTRGVARVLEMGTNIGQNLLAMRNLLPDVEFGAVEINEKAVEQLALIPRTKIFHGSILNFGVQDLGFYDLTMTSGVLIHIEPDFLPKVYQCLYACSTKYIVLVEYYNPTPMEVVYRGYNKRLFKRDFAGELLDMYSDLELVDYGFNYRRENKFYAGDSTWFLLKKNT